MTTCRRCGKTLTDPISIELQIGPVCRVAVKTKDRENNLFNMIRSDYRYYFHQDHLVIEDLNNGNRSVTNDIEDILMDIHCQPETKRLDSYKCVYLDSDKIWDAIDISFIPGSLEKYFVKFAFLSAKTLEQAIERNNYRLQHVRVFKDRVEPPFDPSRELDILIININQGLWGRKHMADVFNRMKDEGITLDAMITMLNDDSLNTIEYNHGEVRVDWVKSVNEVSK